MIVWRTGGLYTRPQMRDWLGVRAAEMEEEAIWKRRKPRDLPVGCLRSERGSSS